MSLSQEIINQRINEGTGAGGRGVSLPSAEDPDEPEGKFLSTGRQYAPEAPILFQRDLNLRPREEGRVHPLSLFLDHCPLDLWVAAAFCSCYFPLESSFTSFSS